MADDNSAPQPSMEDIQRKKRLGIPLSGSEKLADSWQQYNQKLEKQYPTATKVQNAVMGAITPQAPQSPQAKQAAASQDDYASPQEQSMYQDRYQNAMNKLSEIQQANAAKAPPQPQEIPQMSDQEYKDTLAQFEQPEQPAPALSQNPNLAALDEIKKRRGLQSR